MLRHRPIPHVGTLDLARFTDEYVDPAVPVVISGAIGGWPARERWSHSWFAESFGDRRVPVSFGGPLEGRREEMALGDYLRRATEPTERIPPYLRLLALPGVLPELVDDFSIPPYCPRGRGVATHLWIGPAGTVQPFHKDNQNPLAPVHNLLTQVRGRKLVSLVSADQDEKMYRHPAGSAHANYSQVDYLRPDLTRFPRFGDVEVAETVVDPGEMIFIPANTWHHVRSLEPSISLSFWWYTTPVADIVAALAAPEPARPGGTRPGDTRRGETRRIDVSDVEEFGGIWALALAGRSLPVERRPLLLDLCTEPVAGDLRAALDQLATATTATAAATTAGATATTATADRG